MLVARVGSFGYNLLLLLHLATVVVGFGAVSLNGVYNRKAMRAGSSSSAISTANFEVSALAEYAIYLVPVFGILVLLASGKTYQFSDGWVSASFLLYLIGLGVHHAVVRPGHRKLNAALASGRTDSPEVTGLNQRLAVGAAVLNLLLVVILVLMVWKPGG